MVTANAPLRAAVASALDAHGYKVLTAGTYAEGRRLLIDWQPDVLVTTIRLQEHNGLHLTIVSRLSSVLTKTIVIGYADPVLEAEARTQGAVYLTDPDMASVLSAVSGAIERRERRWSRAPADITARVADEAVRVVDLSYGGFRLELQAGTKLSSTEGFDLMVGDLQVPALPVWMKPHMTGERVWCGATVAGNGDSNLAWRHFVDGNLGQPLLGESTPNR